MRGREFKDAVFTQFAQIAGAFGSPKRIEIVDLLAQGERNVEAIARETGLTVANTSRHLQVLKGVSLVATRKEGLLVFYRLADPMVLRGYHALQELAEARLAEVGRLVKDYFAGFFILLENQIRQGDVVAVADKAGLVEEVTLRYVRLRDYDGNVHFIPNGNVSVVTNMSLGFAYAVVDAGVAYGEDVDAVISLIRKAGQELQFPLMTTLNWKGQLLNC